MTARTTTFSRSTRRGSTILLAIGVLATLAIIALVYLANVGAERTNATRVAQEIPYAQASERVRDEIGSLLAADLFGNKVTTRAVPQYVDPLTFNTRIWPRMFEDGEFTDYPFVDGDPSSTTFNPRRPWESPDNVALLDPSGNANPSVARTRDDAWLSTTEPVFNRNTPEASFWPQISNLRDGYRWRPDVNGGRWVRSDGRFVDLAQWFLSNRAQNRGRGDSEADLTPDRIVDFFSGPPYADLPNTPSRGLNQVVYGYQINSLRELADNDTSFGALSQADPNIGPRPVERADERFWADADGDLRPDSRWQTLDSLDGFLGLKWVVAARIIDNSALINVNTALDAGRPDGDILQPPPHAPSGAGAFLADGRTPADVDLFRLLFLANTDPTQNLNVLTNSGWGNIVQTGFGGNFSPPSYYDWAVAPPGLPLRSAFREHMDKGLRLTSLVNDAYERSAGTPRYNNDISSELQWRFTREERAAAYRALLSNRGDRPTAGGAGRVYPLEDELDLRTYWASNDDRTLSELERRLDYGYLPGQSSTNTPTPSDIRGRLSGPLRSSRPTTMDLSLQHTLRMSNQRQGSPTVWEVQDDTRHLLTTYNGVSDASPVPVLNPALISNGGPLNGRPVYDGVYGNRKVRVADFPRGDVSSPEDRAKKASLIRRSFEAFTWALAPLATNEPILPPLTRQDILDARNGATARVHDYHYGGSSTATAMPPNTGGLIGSPAYTMGQASQGVGPPPGAGPSDLGASYAILRAASLAVNLADAVDNQEDPLPDLTTATEEQPTIVRLFNIPEIDPSNPHNNNSPDLSALQPIFDAGVVPMGVRFSHGDISDPTQPQPTSDTVRLPPRFVGAPDRGVTLIGLDRQPFLMEAWTLAYYDTDSAGVAGATIDPNDSARQVGSIIAVELGNPWPEPLLLDGYTIRIQTLDGYAQFSATGEIPVGKSRIVWAHIGRSGGEWDAVVAQWVAHVQGNLAASAEFDDASPATPVAFDANGMSIAATNVIFQQIGQSVGADSGVGAVTLWRNAGIDVMLDRIWVRGFAPPITDKAFPATFRGQVDIPQPPPLGPSAITEPTAWAGRIVAVSSIRRPTEEGSDPNSAAAGFPAWVIESPSHNVITMEPDNAGGGGTAVWYQSWWTDGDPPPPAPPAAQDLITTLATGYPGSGELQDLLGQAKEDFNHAASNRALPAFQLFVPNRPPVRTAGSPTDDEREEWDQLGSLGYTSELHMLCTFAHMYVHSAADPGQDPQIPRAAVPAAIPVIFGMADPTSGGYWRTVSEQLGDPAELTYDASGFSRPNPYLGTLDPSRYTLNRNGNSPSTGMGSVTNLPDALAVPLAIRAFDPFEVLDLTGDLAQGRMNVNTAPVKALRMLPFVSPWFDVAVSTATYGNEFLADATTGGSTSAIANNFDRAGLIVDYRDAGTEFGELSGPVARSNKLVYPGLRTAGEPSGSGFASLGFHHVGELALLAEWNDATLNPGTPLTGTMRSFTVGFPYATFAELADASPAITPVNTGVEASPSAPGVAGVDSVLDVRPNAAGGANARTYDPINDAEERLAVFRAVSNIVSARSDVYTAWFVVRAYDPRRIEAIEVPVGASNAERAALLNQLEPTHESRWLAVFDRSNVRTPTDRPKVLLFTRLPK